MDLQGSRFSQDMSIMQSTLVTFLRQISSEDASYDGNLVLYSRWFCKKVFTQELVAGTRATQSSGELPPTARAVDHGQTGPSLSRPAARKTEDATEQDWANQVQNYLRRTGAAAVGAANEIGGLSVQAAVSVPG